MWNSKKCPRCPTPNTPFDPMLCISCAIQYCKNNSQGCGQSCPGCRAQVATTYPSNPHYRCGKFHQYGTPCPS